MRKQKTHPSNQKKNKLTPPTWASGITSESWFSSVQIVIIMPVLPAVQVAIEIK